MIESYDLGDKVKVSGTKLQGIITMIPPTQPLFKTDRSGDAWCLGGYFAPADQPNVFKTDYRLGDRVERLQEGDKAKITAVLNEQPLGVEFDAEHFAWFPPSELESMQ